MKEESTKENVNEMIGKCLNWASEADTEQNGDSATRFREVAAWLIDLNLEE